MAVATFRFYEELSDFLPSARRKRDFAWACTRGAAVPEKQPTAGLPLRRRRKRCRCLIRYAR
ncbi:MAG: hypothetical protein JNL68_18800 [Burkholderiales bacterium]|nr:hypothetical protein [Burkholderiales bacterium]